MVYWVYWVYCISFHLVQCSYKDGSPSPPVAKGPRLKRSEGCLWLSSSLSLGSLIQSQFSWQCGTSIPSWPRWTCIHIYSYLWLNVGRPTNYQDWGCVFFFRSKKMMMMMMMMMTWGWRRKGFPTLGIASLSIFLGVLSNAEKNANYSQGGQNQPPFLSLMIYSNVNWRTTHRSLKASAVNVDFLLANLP